MTIRIELESEIADRPRLETQVRGMAAEQYAGVLLRTALETEPEAKGKLSPEELHAMLREIAEGSDQLPRLPTSAFTRESFYEGR
jgi:hypothetical protein